MTRVLEDFPAHVRNIVKKWLHRPGCRLVESTRSEQGRCDDRTHLVHDAPVSKGSDAEELVRTVHDVVDRGILLQRLEGSYDFGWIGHDATDVQVVVNLLGREVLRVLGRPGRLVAVERLFDAGFELAP